MSRARSIVGFVLLSVVLSLPASAATSYVSYWTLPAGTGNATYPQQYTTTNAETAIRLRITYFRDNQDIQCWIVRPDGTTLGGPVTFTPADQGVWKTMVASIADGVAFKVKCGAFGLTDQQINYQVSY